MFYTIIRFIAVNFGEEFGKLDEMHGYKFHFITLLFTPVCAHREETLTIGKFQLSHGKHRRPKAIWNKPFLKKYYKAIRDKAENHMYDYPWDEYGDYQIIPNGFVFHHESSEFLFQEQVYIGFNIKTKRRWKMLDNPIFIGLHLRYGEDW
jgi:hypothetical protein